MARPALQPVLQGRIRSGAGERKMPDARRRKHTGEQLMDFIYVPFSYLMKGCLWLAGSSYVFALFFFALAIQIIFIPIYIKQQKAQISSAKVRPLAAALIRGSFEYQGQKCSACSRAFIPASIWPDVLAAMKKMMKEVKMGDVQDFDTFLAAVIDKASFDRCKGFIDRAKESKDCDIVIGGTCDDSKGWFVEPTVIVCKKPDYESMVKEIFGPIVSVYVYPDDKLDETLEICDKASPYALTGAIFAQDREAIVKMEKAILHSAGNFYINDKCTGAV
ncbi:MAG: aldehyde dehydrogenase family protein, partial [Clostridia bacterium]|nr:aldehyde dehydrogenase family protein [Clostridia bacterium]